MEKPHVAAPARDPSSGETETGGFLGPAAQPAAPNQREIKNQDGEQLKENAESGSDPYMCSCSSACARLR